MLPRRTCSASVKAAPLLLTTISSTRDTATIYPRCFSFLFYITALILSLLTYDHLRLNFSHGGLILHPGNAAILEEPYKFKFKATFLTPRRAEPDYLHLNFNIAVLQGRNNLFHTILMFLYVIKTKESGMLG